MRFGSLRFLVYPRKLLAEEKFAVESPRADRYRRPKKERLDFLATRLSELNNTASQILIFLSFAIVAAVTYLSPAMDLSRRTAVHWALRWWIGAIFPTVIGILPLKEFRDRDLQWYNFLLWMRFLLMWSAIACIFIGALQFFKAV